MARTAMIILNYNDYDTTISYINRIKNYNVLDKIIVVDNCSTDNSFQNLRNIQNEKIVVISTNINGGYAKGNNVGLRYIMDTNNKFDYVIISNPDILVTETAIEKLLEVINLHDNCFAVTGEVYTVTNRRIAGFRSKLPTTCNLFVESSIFFRKFLWLLFKYGRQYKNDKTEIEEGLLKAESLPGCFFLADFNKFNEIGFFNEETFLYSEEDILFYKAKSAGYISYVVPNEKIIHAEGTTIKKSISAWRVRERIREESTLVYMKTCLKSSAYAILLYRIWNKIFLVERYLNMRFRTKY